MALIPVLLIAAIFAAVAVLGFGVSNGESQQPVRQEVNALLDDIPQHGATLGSPKAPVTLQIFADLECPTVKLFVESYLPSIVDTWVRTGAVKVKYRSLETDTYNERIFFRQEVAALAAGRQDKMWNFLLTFVHQQGKHFTAYASDEFLGDIASQVPGLKQAQWRRDREDALLTKRVALDVYSAHARDFSSTPSFSVGFTSGKVNQNTSLGDRTSIRNELASSLSRDIESLSEESANDVPSLGPFGTSVKEDGE